MVENAYMIGKPVTDSSAKRGSEHEITWRYPHDDDHQPVPTRVLSHSQRLFRFDEKGQRLLIP